MRIQIKQIAIAIFLCPHVFTVADGSFLFPNFDFLSTSKCSDLAIKLHDLPVEETDDVESVAKPKDKNICKPYEKRSDDPMYRICYEEPPAVVKIGNTEVRLQKSK